MSYARLGGHTVTIVRPAGKDRFGDYVAGTVETTVTGCFVQPRTSTERTDEQDLVVSGLVVYMPAGVDVVATDKIRFDGAMYQVDGDPARWSDNHGTEHHVNVALRLVEG